MTIIISDDLWFHTYSETAYAHFFPTSKDNYSQNLYQSLTSENPRVYLFDILQSHFQILYDYNSPF